MRDVLERLNAALAGRYIIERELGSGGMAVVFLAHDHRLERQVAIKVLRPELASAVAAERFLREVKLTASLAHPHVLPLLESGEADGLLYYVMPYVEGESLREKLDRETRLRVDESVRIAREVADALSYAHERDLLHRDIKPENILLQADHAVVADFGIARALSEAGGEKLTNTGVSIGTPTYMSPEQAAGDRELSEASDLYSLACVLYEMLTGEPPVADSSMQRVVSRKMLGEFVPVRQVRPEVTPEVDAVLTRALATEASERFAAAREFADALAAPHGAARDERPRHRWPLWATAPSVAVVAGLIWYVGWGSGAPEGGRKSIAVLPFENLSPDPDNAYFADGVHDEIISQLSKIADLSVTSRTSVMAYRGHSGSVREIADELETENILEGTVRYAGDRVRITAQLIDARSDEHLWSDSYEHELRDIFAVQADVAREIAAALRASLNPEEIERIEARPTENEEAYEYYLRAQTTDRSTRSGELRAIALYDTAVGLDPGFTVAWAALGRARVRHIWRAGREFTLEEARQAIDRAVELDPDLSATQLALGFYYYLGHRDYDAALEHFNRVRRLEPSNAEAITAVGHIRRREGRWDEAVARLREAVALDPRDAGHVTELAHTLLFMRDYEHAERYVDRALALDSALVSANTHRLILPIKRDGDVDRARLEFEKAVARAGRSGILLTFSSTAAFQSYTRILSREFDGLMRDSVTSQVLRRECRVCYWGQQARMALAHGEALAARAYYDSARVEFDSALNQIEKRPAYEANAWRFIGLLSAYLGDGDRAIEAAERAARVLPISEDAVLGADVLQTLAEVYALTGEHEKAIDALERLLSVPSNVSVPVLRLDTLWDPLRAHPRFQGLMAGWRDRA